MKQWLIGLAVAMCAGSLWAQSKLPAKQSTVSTNGWTEIYRSGSVSPTTDTHTNTVQHVLEWIDKNLSWLRYTVSTNTTGLSSLESDFQTATNTLQGYIDDVSNRVTDIESDYATTNHVATEMEELVQWWNMTKGTNSTMDLTTSYVTVPSWSTFTRVCADTNAVTNATYNLSVGTVTIPAAGAGTYLITTGGQMFSTSSAAAGGEVVLVHTYGVGGTEEITVAAAGNAGMALTAGAFSLNSTYRILMAPNDSLSVKAKCWSTASGRTWINSLYLQGHKIYKYSY